MRSPVFWIDDFNAGKAADPWQAMEDAKEAHAWATRQWERSEGWRKEILFQERKRLALIHAELKRRARKPPC